MTTTLPKHTLMTTFLTARLLERRIAVEHLGLPLSGLPRGGGGHLRLGLSHLPLKSLKWEGPVVRPGV